MLRHSVEQNFCDHPLVAAKFNYMRVEAFSRDDWDGDGVNNEDEIINGTDPTTPFHLVDGRTVLDGYLLSPCNTSLDSDCDGLDNKLELYLGTDPNNMDSDGDFYPDGFEVLHALDPFTAEGSSIEFIPLGFEVGVGDTVRMWAVTRDRTGHLRPGGDVTFQMYYDTSSGDTAQWFSNINFAYFDPGQASSDLRGLVTSTAHTYPLSLNYNKVCYNGSGHPAYCRRHKAKATGSQNKLGTPY